jgi:hypothetical protein
VDLNEDSDPINWDGKLDWNISSRDLATFRVDYQHIMNTFVAPLGPILDGTGSNQGHTQSYLSSNYMLGETHTFSSTLINEFRFAFNWGNDQNLQYNDNVNISANYGLNGVPFNAGPKTAVCRQSPPAGKPLERTATIRPMKARTTTRFWTT